MSIGIAVSKTQLDEVSGSIASDLRKVFDDINELNTWLLGKTESDLTAMGYTVGEVAVLKSAYADIAQLRTIFTGAANLTVAKDFRVFLKQLWGLGGLKARF